MPLPLLAAAAAVPALASAASDGLQKARAVAQDFESVFVSTMLQQMTTGIDGEGPFGGGQSTGIWRNFLTDEYAKSISKSGGLGVADQVYQTLIAQQEVR